MRARKPEGPPTRKLRVKKATAVRSLEIEVTGEAAGGIGMGEVLSTCLHLGMQGKNATVKFGKITGSVKVG